MSIRGKIHGPGQREFSLPVNPKAEDGICRSKTINGQKREQLSAEAAGLYSPCNFLLFICLPSIAYLQRGNSFCEAWGEVRGAVTAFCRKSSQVCLRCDMSRHSTLMQNKAVNGKCQLITVGTLTTSQCIQNVFYLLFSWEREEEGRRLQLGFCPSTSLTRWSIKSEKENGNETSDKIYTVIRNALMLGSSRNCIRKLLFSQMSSECLSNAASEMSLLTCKSAVVCRAAV